MDKALLGSFGNRSRLGLGRGTLWHTVQSPGSLSVPWEEEQLTALPEGVAEAGIAKVLL